MIDHSHDNRHDSGRETETSVIFSVAVSHDSVDLTPHALLASEALYAGRTATTIIAVAGASGSGKTYLSGYMAAQLGAPVLSLDAYYLDLSHLPPQERACWNFDDPASLDWMLLRTQLAALRSGNSVDVPVYDFSTHTRTDRVRRIEAREFLVLEGIFALYDEAVREMVSAGVFIDFPDAGCLERRTARDVAERGRTPLSVREQYDATVRPMFAQYVAPTRRFAQLVVRGDDPPERSFAALRERLGAPR